jgi:hypothetical protein
MDQVTVSNRERTKHLLAIKLRIDERPLVHLVINKTGGGITHTIDLVPREAGQLADWILEPISTGWGFEPVSFSWRQTVPPETILPMPDLRKETAGLLCYVLHALGCRLPAEYGPAWIAGELSAAGIPIEWDSTHERFVTRPKEIVT